MSYTPRPIGRKKSARTAWIIVAIVAIVAIAGIIIAIIVTSNQVGPNPTPTVSPTASPTQSGTKTPTVTPTLSPTPSPTVKPSPSGSGSPSPSPTANPAQAWADTTYGTFATLAWSHTGNAVVRLPQLLGGKIKGGILTFTNNAADDSDFIVQIFDQNGDEMGDPLIDIQGDYAGTVGYGLAAPEISTGSVPTTVQVTSSGNWAVEIGPVSSAPLGVGDYSGDKVVLLPAPKNNTLIVNYGLIGGHFGMTYYYQNQLFQILVPVSGGQVIDQSFALNGVPGVIAVQSGGPWSVAQPN